MAKLDFFVRYPDFFAEVQGERAEGTPIESAMVRHHYGPWDKRYYHVLGFLEARGLINITRVRNSINLSLTKPGKEAASKLQQDPAFSDLLSHMREVFEALGSRNGTQLKNLIYQTFKDDVSDQPLGHLIGGQR